LTCVVIAIVQLLSNGSIDKSPAATVLNSLELDGIDAADSLSRLTTELSSAHAQIAELSTKIGDVEETLSSTQKDLARSQELNTKLQRDVREVGTVEQLLFSLESVIDMRYFARLLTWTLRFFSGIHIVSVDIFVLWY